MRFSIKSFDFYKKLPVDLTEATTQGAVLSVLALLFMIFLFLSEVHFYLWPPIYSEVMLDMNTDAQLRINFNISLPNLQCDFAVVDVLDVLGTNRGNVTKNIMKWHLDPNGEKKELHGFNKEEADIQHETHHRELEAGEEGVLLITKDTYHVVLRENKHVLIDFFVGWCSHCVRLAPTWEAFGRAMDDNPDIKIGKVDCVQDREFCSGLNIGYYPYIQFYTDGQKVTTYRDHRTVEAFKIFAENMMKEHPSTKNTKGKRPNRVQAKRKLENAARTGCMMYGYLMVNRVPGNFHIEARSKHHNMNKADMSHTIHALNFGPQHTESESRFDVKAATNLQMIMRSHHGIIILPELSLLTYPGLYPQGTKSINNSVHINHTPHEAHHHYIKVVSTFYPQQRKKLKAADSGGDLLRYQLIHSSQVMQYETYRVPEAKFSFDISPMCMSVKYRERYFYQFITSVLAIVGGTFTMVGILDNIIFRVFKAKLS